FSSRRRHTRCLSDWSSDVCSSDLQKKLAAIAQQDPAIEAFLSSAGARGYTTSNSGVLFMHLKPRKERSSIDEVVQRLRAHLSVEIGRASGRGRGSGWGGRHGGAGR